jgi:hypothetical protein
MTWAKRGPGGPRWTAVMIGERITDFIKTDAGPIINQLIKEQAK